MNDSLPSVLHFHNRRPWERQGSLLTILDTWPSLFLQLVLLLQHFFHRPGSSSASFLLFSSNSFLLLLLLKFLLRFLFPLTIPPLLDPLLPSPTPPVPLSPSSPILPRFFTFFLPFILLWILPEFCLCDILRENTYLVFWMSAKVFLSSNLYLW